MHRSRALLSSCLLMVVGLLLWQPVPVAAAIARTEVLPFNTVTMSDQQLLRGKGGEETGIAGVLRLPAEKNNPVVIIVYGTGGYGLYLDDWVDLLKQHGIGSFLIDSTSGRIQGESGDQASLRQLAVIRDAYAALDLLSQHPAVDHKRIGLMGFSKAGQGALYAATERMHSLYGKPGVTFAGVVSMYPNCSFRYREDDQLIKSPVRLFHGEADDVNAFGPCQNLVQRASRAGADIRLTGYPGVAHGFDRPSLRNGRTESGSSVRDCSIAEGVKGLLINQDTGRLFRFDDDCVRHTMGARYDANATADVKQRIPKFFESLFWPSSNRG